MEICFNNAIKNFGFNNVLDSFDMEINRGDKVALVGPNGCGKSTILKIIAGYEELTKGLFTIRRNAKIGFLNQVISDYDDELSVYDFLRLEFKEIFEIEKKIRSVEKKILQNKSNMDMNIRNYSNLQEKFLNLGGYEIDDSIHEVCEKFNINKELLDRKFNLLSGGEKTLVTLASIMINKPEILLLDEPTNHLDIKTIEWLEEFLTTYEGTVIISSHDRYFLDSVVKKIFLINRGQSEIFHGNYSYFLIENEKRILNEFNQFKNQQRQIKAMEESIKRLREWGERGDNPAFFRRAICIERRLLKMTLIDKPDSKKELPIDFEIKNRSGVDVLKINDFSFSYDENILFDKSSLEIKFNEKVCLMGNNGSGKSSLIKKILEGDENIFLGSNIKIGYIPQIISFTDENKTVIEIARDHFIGDESHLRSGLAKFMFYNEMVFKLVKNLSGGEKIRLKLFCVIQDKANFLIFDEPTNHIDIETKEILEDALINFSGTLLFVSHDRYFINKVAEYVVNIENKKMIKYYGSYDYFKTKKKEAK